MREELQQTDKKKRKLTTMRKDLHPKDDIDRLYVSRNEERKGLASIEDGVDVSIIRLENYIKKNKERLSAANEAALTS